MGNWIGNLPDALIQSDTEFSVYFLSSCIHSLGFEPMTLVHMDR